MAYDYISPLTHSIPPRISAVSNFTVSGSNGRCLQVMTGQYRVLNIQNLSTGQLYVKFGDGASNTSFNTVLKGNTVQDFGDGGSLTNDYWNGVVSVSGQVVVAGVGTGQSPRYVAWTMER